MAMPASFLVNLDKAQAYDASNLISDAEFINSEVLDAHSVQSFLNTRGGSRLRTFSEGGRTAAQIIADAARANGISPYVILATIQKEESIVDSNYNFDYRVVWAMGYAICDSCSLDDPNVQKYRGFTKQIDNGTWQLKYNYSQCAVSLCWDSRDWNVGRTMIIDDTAVRFGNRATSALYRYTPHLHGNQNFYNIYNSYKTFFYKAGSGKTKVVVGKGVLAAQKLKIATSKNKGGQENQSVQTHNAAYVNQASPANLRPGQTATIYVYLRNTGTSTWYKNGANPVYLGSSSPQDRGSVFTVGRNVRWQMLNSSVTPGNVGVFSIQIIAPQGGTYVEKFKPVMEGVTWFGDEISFTFNVSTSGNIKLK